jgi:branched-subunit amino acid transport protein
VTSPAAIWTVILVLGAGTYALRLSFLGLIGSRELPPWVLRLLAYVPVAVLPALVAPLVVWPAATGGEPDAPRMIAAAAALAVGALARGVLSAIAAGMAVLYLALWLLG